MFNKKINLNSNFPCRHLEVNLVSPDQVFLLIHRGIRNLSQLPHCVSNQPYPKSIDCDQWITTILKEKLENITENVFIQCYTIKHVFFPNSAEQICSVISQDVSCFWHKPIKAACRACSHTQRDATGILWTFEDKKGHTHLCVSMEL